MAQEGADLYGETFFCSICMNLLKEPVTISCGHSYCKTCINRFWNVEAVKNSYSCPQCRKTSSQRPDLGKNIMMADVVEKINKSRQHDDPDVESYATAEDVACDFCTGRKLKAFKSCLVCLTSYCQKHLQPHHESAAFKRHKLVDPSKKLQETEEHSEKMFTEMIRFLRNRRSEMKKLVRSKKQTEVSRAQDLQEKLEQEISELKKRNAELQQISTTEDDIQFVLSYRSLSALSVSTHSSIILTRPENCFEEVTAAVSELREHLDKVLMEDWTKVCHTVERVEVLLTSEQKIRAGFLKYSQEMTLDPNTAQINLRLSEGNRKITFTSGNQDHPPHPDRFTDYYQVLSRESATGRCYWEVEWRGGKVNVGVTYKSIRGTGTGSRLGYNNKSWMLECETNKYIFRHNNKISTVPGPHSSRIGMYVDHIAGVLSFYSICDTMTLLHRVNTTFTEPLHLGLCVWYYRDTAELSTL